MNKVDQSAEWLDDLQRLQSVGGDSFSVTESPPLFVGAEGAYLIAADGRRYLDMASGAGVNNLGPKHPRIVAAIRAQLDGGVVHIGPNFHAPVQAQLYRRLAELLPKAIRCFQPATNGTEAVEIAIKAAMHATGRRQFVGFYGGYHGRTLGALAVSHTRGPSAVLQPFAPMTHFLPFPTSEMEAARGEALVEKLFDHAVTDLDRIAGVIIEPVQASAGVRAAPARFLRHLAQQAQSRDIPLILDEVFTGMGRSGKLFAFEHFGIEPDLLILGNALCGGLPGGLVTGRPEILNAWKPGAQSSTFQMHPLSAAASLAALTAIDDDRLLENARRIGEWLQSLAGDLRSFKCVADMRCFGAMAGIDIIGGDGKPNPPLAAAIRRGALDAGLLTWACGMQNNVVALLPPITASEQEIRDAVGLLAGAIRKMLG